MIKFFRKIRQKLLTENNLSKYLIYAIGEVILVVAGILIALSINNASENRKDRAKEQIYLESLYQELKRDSIYFESTEGQLSKIEKAGRDVISFIENPKILSKDSLKFLNDIRQMIRHNQSLPEPIVWKELQNSGNLRLIKNRELIEMLYTHYHLVKSVQLDYDNNAHPFILKGRYFDSKTFSITDQDDYFDNWKKDSLSSPTVFKSLLEDTEFYEISKGIVTGMIISRIRLLAVRKRMEKPLVMLRGELEIK